MCVSECVCVGRVRGRGVEGVVWCGVLYCAVLCVDVVSVVWCGVCVWLFLFAPSLHQKVILGFRQKKK